jgi:CRP-like cAMP-binding protein
MSKGTLGKAYRDGEVIVRQGDVGNCMYVVQEGTVEVFAQHDEKEVPLRTLGKGEIIGEMSLFDREVRSATVRAKGEARLLTIDKESFLRRVHEDPSLAFNVVKTMARRIRELSDELTRLRSGG